MNVNFGTAGILYSRQVCPNLMVDIYSSNYLQGLLCNLRMRDLMVDIYSSSCLQRLLCNLRMLGFSTVCSTTQFSQKTG